MAWSQVYFQRLYYTVAGGPEHELTGNSLTVPPLFAGGEHIDAPTWFASQTSSSRVTLNNDWNRGSYQADFEALYALNGGRGVNFWYYYEQMNVGDDIVIYKDRGNPSIALIFRKKAGYQWDAFTKWFNTVTQVVANFQMTSNDAATSTHPAIINQNAFNIGFVFDGSSYYRIMFCQVWGREGTGGYAPNDTNGYDIAILGVNQNLSNTIAYLISGNLPPQPSPDPYAPVGPSSTTPSSTGTFDAESDAIALPSTPTLSAQSSGLISLYVIDTANMATFANFLLSGSFNDSTLKKLFTSPMEAILCLNYFPYTPPKAGTATEISIGKAATGANGYLLTGQYDTVSCGTVDLDEYYGSCLDMSPYTSVSLVLPYCGAVDLDPDEFMGKTIGVTYKIDCYTGACLALVTADGNVMLQVQGMLSNPMPIMASNYSSIVSGIASTAIAALGTLIAVGTGGVGTPAAIAMAGGVAAVGANSVMNAKVHYNHGGSGGMGTGLFGVQKPYLIVKRPRACVPDNNGNFQGYPTFVTIVLGNCSGYTKINEIHLDGITATDAEKKELESILKGGVWF